MPEGYNKLVRDNIPEHLDAQGIPYDRTTATPEEYKKRLLEKLTEETKELLEAGSVEELADVLEVIDALRKLPEFSNVLEVKARKLAEKGGFEKRIVLKGEK